MYFKKADINTTALANGGAIFSSNYYWSSSEVSGDGVAAWEQSFGDGFKDRTNKSYTYRVRAVRSF